MDSDIRAVLNKAKWDDRCNLSQLHVAYVDRGQPDDTSVATGDDIVDIMQHFFKTDDGMIPFHRIITIKYGGEVLFKR